MFLIGDHLPTQDGAAAGSPDRRTAGPPAAGPCVRHDNDRPPRARRH